MLTTDFPTAGVAWVQKGSVLCKGDRLGSPAALELNPHPSGRSFWRNCAHRQLCLLWVLPTSTAQAMGVGVTQSTNTAWMCQICKRLGCFHEFSPQLQGPSQILGFETSSKGMVRSLCFPFGDGVPPHCLQCCLPWVRRNSPVSTRCCGTPQPSTRGNQGKLERPQDPSVSVLEQPLGMHRGCHRLHIHGPARWGAPLWGAGVTFGVCLWPLPSWQHRHRHLFPKKTAVDPKSSLCP